MIKSYLFLFVFSCGALFGNQNNRKFDVAISLGEVCQSATNLHVNGLRLQSYPLDWLITPFDGLLKFITDEGYGLIDKNNLTFNIKDHIVGRGVINRYYGIYIVHDFEYSVKGDPNVSCSYSGAVVKNFDEVKKKFKKRTKRFFDILHSDQKVLLLRLGISHKDAITLDQLIHTRYPNLDYLIVAVDNTEEIKNNWGMERVKNFYIDRPGLFISNPEDWTRIFMNFEFSFPINKPSPKIDANF